MHIPVPFGSAPVWFKCIASGILAWVGWVIFCFITKRDVLSGKSLR